MSLDQTIANLNKKYGAGSVLAIGTSANNCIERTSSGSVTLDLAMGGGLPVGRIIEYFGPESSGKTTMALLAMADVQKKGRKVAFIDAEHALDPSLAKAYGLNVDEMWLNQPSTAEEALDVTEHLASTGEFGLIVIDSVSSLLPSYEAESDVGANTIGLQARFMGTSLRRLTPICGNNKCTVIFINQIREKVGVMYGSNETTSGGRALRFYSSIRVEIRPNGGVAGRIKDSAGNIIGVMTKCNVVKNKTYPPYREAIVKLIFGQGIDKAFEISTAAILADVIKQGGAWFTFSDKKHEFKIQGRDALDIYLNENPKILEYITNLIKKP